MRARPQQSLTRDPDQDQDPDSPAEAALPGYSQPRPWSPGPGRPSFRASPDDPEGAGSGPESSGAAPAPAALTLTRPFSPDKASAFEAIARGFFKAAGGLLNRTVQADDQDESWLPDDDDEATVPPPIGRLAARRVPVGDGTNLSDMEDIGAAVVGLLAWAAKGLTSMWEARRRRRRAAKPPGAVVYDNSGQDEAGQ